MNRAGTKVVGAVAAVLVALGTGCGGGSERLSKSDYEQKLKAEGSELKTAFSATNIESSSGFEELAKQIAKLQRSLDRSASDIEALKPPKDAEADNQKIADALHKAADKFGELKQAAKDHDLRRIQKINKDVSTVLDQGKSAASDLKSKGYDIGALGQG
jgi:SMC interacting uncharacterized protein involved in chromosome segregation